MSTKLQSTQIALAPRDEEGRATILSANPAHTTGARSAVFLGARDRCAFAVRILSTSASDGRTAGAPVLHSERPWRHIPFENKDLDNTVLHQTIQPASDLKDPHLTASLRSDRPTGGRILVVDDDVTTRGRTVRFFESQGCKVRGVDGRADLVGLTRHGKWSLVVLHSRPPSTEGLEQLHHIRSQSSVPILIEGMSSPIDRIVALELGADCHVPESAELQELWACARAVVRRQDIGRTVTGSERERGGFSFAGWELHRANRSLVAPSGKHVTLTRTAFALLLSFLEAPRRVLTRAHLLQATRRHEDVFDRSIDVQVFRLRGALNNAMPGQRLIRTERGLGYVFECDDIVRLF